MRLDEVQTELAAKLSGNATTAEFLPGLIFGFRGCKKTSGESLSTDEDVSTFLASRLADSGVVFEIGIVSGVKSDERSGRWQTMRATTSLVIAESIPVTHTPADDALLHAVLNAVTAPDSGSESPFTVESFDKEVSEKGYVLHMIEVSAPVEIR